MIVAVSLFERAADNSPDEHQLSAEEFLNSFMDEPELVEGVTLENAKAMKNAGRAWGGSFTDGARSKKNFQSIPAAVFDLDGPAKEGVELEPVLAILESFGLAYAVHSTFSSGFAAPRHKLRVVLPVTRPVNAAEYVALWDKYAEVLGADDACRSPERIHFAPRIPEQHRGHYFAKVVSDRPYLTPRLGRSLNDARTGARDWLQELRTTESKDNTLVSASFRLGKEQAFAGSDLKTALADVWDRCEAALRENPSPVNDWVHARDNCTRNTTAGFNVGLKEMENPDPLGTPEPSLDKKKIRKAEKELEAARKQLKRAGNHDNLSRQARIMGEYVATGAIDEHTVRAVLLAEAEPGGDAVFETALATGKAAVKPDSRVWARGLPLTEEGTVKVSDNSIVRVLREHPECKGLLYYDLRGGCVSTRIIPPWRGDAGRADVDKCAASCMEWLCDTLQGDVSLSRTKECFVAAALEDEIDPFKDYLEGLEWDGHDRLTTWLQTYVKCEDSEYVRLVGRKWLISAVARTFEPGVKVDTMLVFTGKQGKGKSTVFENLMPDKNWYSDHLPDIDDKDVHLELARLVISEMGELSQVQKKTMERVKQFITMKAPSVRGSYEHAARPRPRRGVFCATTNTPSDFLEDEEARRFWLVAVTGEKCDYNGISSVRDQLWAEAVAAYRACEPWHLDEAGEKLSKAVEEIMVRRDVLAEDLEDYAENGIPERYLTSAAEDNGGKHINVAPGQLTEKRVPLFLTVHNVCELLQLDVRKSQKYAANLLMAAGYKKGPRAVFSGRTLTPYWNSRTLKR
jgi:predicted P-loop ATPase